MTFPLEGSKVRLHIDISENLFSHQAVRYGYKAKHKNGIPLLRYAVGMSFLKMLKQAVDPLGKSTKKV